MSAIFFPYLLLAFFQCCIFMYRRISFSFIICLYINVKVKYHNTKKGFIFSVLLLFPGEFEWRNIKFLLFFLFPNWLTSLNDMQTKINKTFASAFSPLLYNNKLLLAKIYFYFTSIDIFIFIFNDIHSLKNSIGLLNKLLIILKRSLTHNYKHLSSS